MDSRVKLISMFGEEEIVEARVKILSLVDHKIILEPL
jgi:predicted RNA-binding protein